MDWVTIRLRLNSGMRAGWRGERRVETPERLRGAWPGHGDSRRALARRLPGCPNPCESLTAPNVAYYRFMGRDDAGEVSARERRALRAEHVYTDSEIGELADLVVARHGPETASYVIFYNKKGPNRVQAAMRMAGELERRGCSGALTTAGYRRFGNLFKDRQQSFGGAGPGEITSTLTAASCQGGAAARLRDDAFDG